MRTNSFLAPPRRPAITAPRSPNNRAGPFGVGPTPLGLSTRTATKPLFGDPVSGALSASAPSAGAQARAGIGVGGAKPITYQPPQAPTATGPQQQPGPQGTTFTQSNLSYDYSADPILNQIQALSSQGRTDAQANALMLRKQAAIAYGDPSAAGDDAATAAAASGNPFSYRARAQRDYEQQTQGYTTQLQQGEQQRQHDLQLALGNYQHDLAQNLAQSGLARTDQTRTLEDALNKDNLFYSGARQVKLGELGNVFDTADTETRRMYGQAQQETQHGYDTAHQQAQAEYARLLGQGTTDYQQNLYDLGIAEQGALGGIGSNLAAALSAADTQDSQAQQDAADRALQMALLYGTDPGAGGAITPAAVNQVVDPTTSAPLGANITGTGPLPVGATNNPLIYALLGRRMDPRYNY